MATLTVPPGFYKLPSGEIIPYEPTTFVPATTIEWIPSDVKVTVMVSAGAEVLITPLGEGFACDQQVTNSAGMDIAALYRHFPILAEMVDNPESLLQQFVSDAIVNLNDEFKWSRERIADWVAVVEAEKGYR